MAQKGRKKLYFDFNMGIGATRVIFPCTQAVQSAAGDRYGGLLDALEACTLSTPSEVKRRNEVAAWASAVTGLSGGALMVDFIGWTSGNGTGPIVKLPFPGVNLTTTDSKAGQSAVFGTGGIARHFSVRIRRLVTFTVTTRGTVYVQRQHSIEV